MSSVDDILRSSPITTAAQAPILYSTLNYATLGISVSGTFTSGNLSVQGSQDGLTWQQLPATQASVLVSGGVITTTGAYIFAISGYSQVRVVPNSFVGSIVVSADISTRFTSSTQQIPGISGLGAALQVIQMNSAGTAAEWGDTLGTGRVVRESSLVTPTFAPGASAVGTDTTGVVTAAGAAWVSQTGPGGFGLTSVCHGNGRYVAVGAFAGTSRAVWSPDGINWQVAVGAGSVNYRSVCFGAGRFVAVGSSGAVRTSEDGINWTSRTAAAANDWRSVCYGKGLFVAVSIDGTGNRVMTSPDGITWTSRTSAADNEWYGVCFGRDSFVAVASTGTGNRVMTSPDGITWAIQTSAADNNWRAVCYGNGVFVAVAVSGTGNRVMTSPNGTAWTLRTSAADVSWSCVAFGNGMFVAVAPSAIMTSAGGTTWVSRTSPAAIDWVGVAFGNGAFIGVANNTGTNNIMSSGRQMLAIVPDAGVFVGPRVVRGTLLVTGTVTLSSLAGAGTRTVVADANGVLSAP